jgi:hypothetical protein
MTATVFALVCAWWFSGPTAPPAPAVPGWVEGRSADRHSRRLATEDARLLDVLRRVGHLSAERSAHLVPGDPRWAAVVDEVLAERRLVWLDDGTHSTLLSLAEPAQTAEPEWSRQRADDTIARERRARVEARREARRRVSDMVSCLRQSAGFAPAPRTRLTIELTIRPTGAVEQVAVASTHPRQVAAESCITGAALGWTFPASFRQRSASVRLALPAGFNLPSP